MVQGIHHITFTVSDVDRAFDFYTRILGCQPVQRNPRSAYVMAGPTWIALDNSQGLSPAPATDYTHLAFTVDAGEYARLVVALARYPVRCWKENSSEGESFYFLDPDGHQLELATSDLGARIAHGKATWGDNVEWFV